MNECRWHVGPEEKMGYLQWHHRAEESSRRGARQRRCVGCGLYFFAWEARAGRFPRDRSLLMPLPVVDEE